MKRYSVHAFDFFGGKTVRFWTYNSALTHANDIFYSWDCIEIIDNWRNRTTKIKWIERTPTYEMNASGGPGRLTGFMPE